jgi:DNA repair exonuclease SbcCD ATPase subunit
MEEIKKTVIETYQKVVGTIVDPIKNRLGNPLFGSFIITWVIVNWRPVLYIIFERNSILKKFEYIDLHYYPDGNWWRYLWLPLIISSFYAIGITYVETAIGWFSRYSNRIKIKRHYDLEEKDLKEQTKILNLKNDIENINELTEKLEKSEKDVRDKQRTILEKEEDLGLRINELAELKVSLRTAKDSSDNFKALLDQKTEEITEKNTTIQTLNQNISELGEKIDNSNIDLNNRNDEISIFKKTVSTLERSILDLNNQIDVKKMELMNSENEIERLRSINIQLGSQVEQLKLQNKNDDENYIELIENSIRNYPLKYNLETNRSIVEMIDGPNNLTNHEKLRLSNLYSSKVEQFNKTGYNYVITINGDFRDQITIDTIESELKKHVNVVSANKIDNKTLEFLVLSKTLKINFEEFDYKLGEIAGVNSISFKENKKYLRD